MELPIFSRNTGCKQCPLHEGASKVCIPARPFSNELRTPLHTTALLIVGEAPAAHEEEHDKCFVGPTGYLMDNLYVAPKKRRPALWDFSEHADVYYANALRCRRDGKKEPSIAEVGLCGNYLADDIKALQDKYKDVVVLATGTIACKAVLQRKISKSFGLQGHTMTLGGSRPFRVFVTYHPAILFNRRAPAKVHAIYDHLRLLHSYLSTGQQWKVPSDFPDPVRRPPLPTAPPYLIAIDIETYGSIKGLPAQRYFQPNKCMAFDKVARKDLIQSIGVGYRDEKGTLRSGIFLMRDDRDKQAFRDWLQYIRNNRVKVGGMSFKFDGSMIRAAYPEWTATLFNEDCFDIEDVSVYNYLHNEVRPERSLKNLSYLFGITEYKKTLKDGLFASVLDRDFQRYQAEDCLATVVCLEFLKDRIRQDYGADTPKLSAYTAKWYSQLVWEVIRLSEYGVAIDVPMMERQGQKVKRHCTKILDAYFKVYGKPLAGKKSKATRTEIAKAAFRLSGLEGCKELHITKATDSVSFDANNRHLFTKALKEKSRTATHDWEGWEILRKLRIMDKFAKKDKLFTAYLRPFVDLSIHGTVYPNWYPVPAPSNKKSDDDALGTIQCRITCNEPGVQTLPRRLKTVYVSRHRMGFVLESDLSQIELRIAGLLSNDPGYRHAFENDVDIHIQTAVKIFGEEIINHPDFEEVYRQAGKRTNFLMIYRGGPQRLRETLLQYAKLDLPLHECAKIISDYFRVYSTLNAYHQSLFKEALAKGYVEVPLLGPTRYVAGSPKVMLGTYENVIANVPVQATAANILINAQRTLNKAFRDEGMQSISTHQIYDSIYVDGPEWEYDRAVGLVHQIMDNPPYYQDLCRVLGRRLPLAHNIKTRWFKR